LPPIGAKYLKLQIITSATNEKSSEYILDNVRLDEIVDPGKYVRNGFDAVHLDEDQNLVTVMNDSTLREHFKKFNSTHYITESKLFPIKPDHLYNYTMDFEEKNAYPLYGFVSFRNSGDVVTDTIKYGANASNGAVLSLSNGSHVYSKLDIIKPSDYTIAMRANSCETCGNLTWKIIEVNKDVENNDKNNIKIGNISLKDKNSGLKWSYSNSTYLRKGTYEFQINTDSKTDLDSVVLYSVVNNNSSNKSTIHNEILEDLFNPKVAPPAQILGYKKIDSTKHILNIKNATKPYMISFAESYDPLWRAYTSTDDNNSENSGNNRVSFVSNSIPLYSVINGFYINKTGNYSLIIEYQPQKWFIQGATISIISLVAMFTGLLLLRNRSTITKLYSTINETLSRYRTQDRGSSETR